MSGKPILSDAIERSKTIKAAREKQYSDVDLSAALELAKDNESDLTIEERQQIVSEVSQAYADGRVNRTRTEFDFEKSLEHFNKTGQVKDFFCTPAELKERDPSLRWWGEKHLKEVRAKQSEVKAESDKIIAAATAKERQAAEDNILTERRLAEEKAEMDAAMGRGL